MPKETTNLTGQRFGKLTVKSFLDYRRGRAHWLCECDCGNVVEVRGTNLTKNNLRSCGCNKRLSFGQSSLNKTVAAYRTRAIKKCIPFELTQEDCSMLFSQNCRYCNQPPSNFSQGRGSNGGIFYNGIDRVDNSKGYVPENCVPCCKLCNQAKSNLGVSEFLMWAKRLVEFQENL